MSNPINDFFAGLYEGWGLFWLGNFSTDLYNNLLYMPIGLVMLISAFVWMFLYYYVIDHPRFAKWYHWLIWLLILCTINFAAGWWISYNKLYSVYVGGGLTFPSYTTEFFSFSLINAFWTFIIAFAVSILIKWKSVMCRRTPF